MFVAIAALVLAATPQIAHTAPVTSRRTPTTSDVVIAAGFPIRALNTLRNAVVRTATTLPAGRRALSGRSPLANTTTLLLCPTTDCASCTGFDLNAYPHNECILTDVTALSVAIYQPSNAGLPFAVTVGPAGCATLAQLPIVDECANLNVTGGPFTNFALLDLVPRLELGRRGGGREGALEGTYGGMIAALRIGYD